MLFRSNDTATTEIYTVSYTLSLHDALPIFEALALYYATAESQEGANAFREKRPPRFRDTGAASSGAR